MCGCFLLIIGMHRIWNPDGISAFKNERWRICRQSPVILYSTWTHTATTSKVLELQFVWFVAEFYFSWNTRVVWSRFVFSRKALQYFSLLPWGGVGVLLLLKNHPTVLIPQILWPSKEAEVGRKYDRCWHPEQSDSDLGRKLTTSSLSWGWPRKEQGLAVKGSLDQVTNYRWTIGFALHWVYIFTSPLCYLILRWFLSVWISKANQFSYMWLKLDFSWCLLLQTMSTRFVPKMLFVF